MPDLSFSAADTKPQFTRFIALLLCAKCQRVDIQAGRRPGVRVNPMRRGVPRRTCGARGQAGRQSVGATERKTACGSLASQPDRLRAPIGKFGPDEIAEND